MSSTTRIGNILSVGSGIIMHGCNAQGVMGAGLAKSIKALYPGAFNAYRCQSELSPFGLELGSVVMFTVDENLRIANAITQEYYGSRNVQHVSYDAIRDAFSEVFFYAKENGIEDVHFPKIGCGHGGGEWSIVQGIINDVTAEFSAIRATLWIPE